MALWIAHSGVNRSKTYEMLAQKQLRGFKNGRQMLIDIEHGLAYLRSLPKAEIRPRKTPRRPGTPLTEAITPEMVARIVRAGDGDQAGRKTKKQGKRSAVTS
jgi:hypothetical protein